MLLIYILKCYFYNIAISDITFFKFTLSLSQRRYVYHKTFTKTRKADWGASHWERKNEKWNKTQKCIRIEGTDRVKVWRRFVFSLLNTDRMYLDLLHLMQDTWLIYVLHKLEDVNDELKILYTMTDDNTLNAKYNNPREFSH